MKKFKISIMTKLIVFITISNILLATLVAMVSAGLLLKSYDNEINLKSLAEVEAKKLVLEISLYKIESVVDTMRLAISQSYKEIQDMDTLEEAIIEIFADYLLGPTSASYSLYTYFDPELDGRTHDVWLTNNADGLQREDEIPLERYISRYNMAWFYDVKDHLTSKWIPPYRNRYDQYISSYVMPVMNGNYFLGIVGMYLDLNNIDAILYSDDESMQFWALNDLGEIVYHPFYEEGSSIESLGISLDVKSGDSYALQEIEGEAFRHYTTKLHNGWQFIYSIKEKKIQIEKQSILLRLIAVTALYLVFIQLIIYGYSKRYKRGYNNMIDVLADAKIGEYKNNVSIVTKDELSTLSHAINDANAYALKTIKKLREQAYKNRLSQLPNFEKMNDILSYWNTEDEVIMFLLNINNFKGINSLIGRNRGDVLLKQIAKNLKSYETPDFLLFHTKGDEFAFIGINKDLSEIEAISKKLLSVFNEYNNITNVNFTIACALGIAKYPDDTSDITVLYPLAKLAMLESKNSNHSNYKIYSRFLSSKNHFSNELETDIAKAISNKEFVLFYQPIFDGNKSLNHFEVFLRWLHPQKGLLEPSYFLEYLEESGLICLVGEIVFEQISNDYHILNEHNITFNQISINLSNRQLLNPLLVSSILGQLRKNKMPLEGIQLEIEENQLHYDHEQSIKKLKALQTSGIKIVLSNFGKQSISLKNIYQLPITGIKIDKEIIHNENHKITHYILESIIDLAHKINLSVTAECIEKEGQFDLLHSKKSDYFQGYFLGDPEPLEKIIERYKTNL